VRGRQVCWSDPKLQELARKFIPATDEVWRLHNRKDLDCLFFQKFCEDGHYGGRSRPTNTRQGIYCCTPAGQFLASVNTTDPRRMERMLREALAAWRKIPKKERLLDYDPATRAGEISRREAQYPQDGLALRVHTRDMPRQDIPNDWRAVAWNVDSLWYRKAEARQMLPAAPKPGATVAWPAPLVQRLVRHHLVDNARGQTNGYTAAQVKAARIEATVVRVQKGVVFLALAGESHTEATGTWARGVRTKMIGEAEYDLAKQAFVRFELVAQGARWGRTMYNAREDDTKEAPIAFAIIFDPDDPGRRVAPAGLGNYGW